MGFIVQRNVSVCDAFLFILFFLLVGVPSRTSIRIVCFVFNMKREGSFYGSKGIYGAGLAVNHINSRFL